MRWLGGRVGVDFPWFRRHTLEVHCVIARSDIKGHFVDFFELTTDIDRLVPLLKRVATLLGQVVHRAVS